MVMASRRNKLKVCEQDLDNLTKEELILQVQRLKAHNSQLKNVISKNLEEKKISEGSTNKRKFDFTKCPKRHIFLKILYLGWDYQGYAAQEDTNKTIEWELFQALRKSCLIEDRTTSNYHRCGRTDKGVSAFGQVISIDVRSKIMPNQSLGNEGFDKSTANVAKGEDSNLLEGEVRSQGSPDLQPNEEDTRGELEYCKILNRLLPRSIRAIAWSPVQPHESARFNCKKRIYKYFFPRGTLNIQRMVTAAENLVGVHDFRNLCKMDVGNGVINFQRKIFGISIKVLNGDQLIRSSESICFEDKHSISDLCLHCHDKMDTHDNEKCFQKIKSQEPTSQEMEECRESKYVDTGGGNSQDCTNYTKLAVPKSVVPKGEVQCSVSEEVSERKQSKQGIYDMCELTVVGQAFLWHQIRCIMTVLFLVGQGKEDPSVVEHLLNVDTFPRKPQYSLASEIPLNLFASDFESSLNWVYDRECIFSIIKDLQREWTMLSVRASMIRQMLTELDNEDADDWDASELTNCLMTGIRPRSYVPLLKRELCESLEDRIDHFVKKKRLDLEVNSEK